MRVSEAVSLNAAEGTHSDYGDMGACWHYRRLATTVNGTLAEPSKTDAIF